MKIELNMSLSISEFQIDSRLGERSFISWYSWGSHRMRGGEVIKCIGKWQLSAEAYDTLKTGFHFGIGDFGEGAQGLDLWFLGLCIGIWKTK